MNNIKADKKKYEQCCDYILNYIKHNQLTKGQKLPTEDQLIEMNSVSRITVRRAISELEEKGIVYKVRGSGTFVADNLKSTPTHIPLIFPDEFEGINLFYDIVKGLNSYLNTQSHYITLFISNPDTNPEEKIITQLLSYGIQQMIIFPNTDYDNQVLYSRLEQQGARFIFLDHMPQGHSGDLIQCDNIQGGQIAVRHLVEQGYRRIAFLCFDNEPVSPFFLERATGYKNVLSENSLPIKDEYICFCSNDSQSKLDCIEKLMSLPKPPDAIFCANDHMAVDAFNILTDLSYSVPEDVALIGFDDLDDLNELPIGVSTISQSYYDLGYEAARTTCDILNGYISYKTHKLLPTALIERESTPKRHE